MEQFNNLTIAESSIVLAILHPEKYSSDLVEESMV